MVVWDVLNEDDIKWYKEIIMWLNKHKNQNKLICKMIITQNY